MLNFLIQNTKFILAVLALLLSVQGYFNYQQQVTISSLNSRVLDVSNELKDAKLKISKLEEIEKFRVEQINKWEKESLEKESELAKATTTILNQQNKLDSLSKDKWEKVEFTNDCKKDINILKHHALDIKGKWK